MTTVSDVFGQLGLNKWWTIPIIQRFGGRSNGEWGDDFPMPVNTPVGSISDGRVVHVGPDPTNPTSSVGQVVQVQAPDGSLYHYQHLRAASVTEGQAVQAGDVIGLSGGCPANGYAKGGGCAFTDQDSTGPHIEVRYSPTYNPSAGFWYQQWEDPTAHFQAQAGSAVDGSTRGTIASGALLGNTSNTTGQTNAPSTTGPGVSCLHKVSIFPGASFCMDPVVDGFSRAALLAAGAGLIVFSILIFLGGHEDARNAVGGYASRARGAFAKIGEGLAAAG